jgi:predicted transcriptional regulator
MAETNESNSLQLATELTIAWLSNPNTRAPAEEVPAFIQRMHDAVKNLEDSAASQQSEESSEEFTPAVSVRKSLASPYHIISMIDGKPYRTLRRHLARHGLTPDQYRERYGRKADYPMVSQNYSQVRRDMAKKIGLGRTAKQEAPAAVNPPPRRGRRKKADAASEAQAQL